MSWTVAVLIASAAAISLAALRRSQWGLFVAVMAYMAVFRWVILNEFALVMPTLALAIVLALGGLVMVLYRDLAGDAADRAGQVAPMREPQAGSKS